MGVVATLEGGAVPAVHATTMFETFALTVPLPPVTLQVSPFGWLETVTL
jgi:hypothetical protein